MWRNYLTVGLRALIKSKTHAFINIVGLALALAPCLILLLFVRYETSYDRWILGSDRVFQLQTFIAEGPLGEPEALQNTSFAAHRALEKEFPQVEKSVWVTAGRVVTLQDGEPSKIERFSLVDGNLFDIMPLPFLKGDPKHALARPGDMVLTQSEADKRFPRQDPMGKTLTLIVNNRQPADYRVTGILRDPPKNMHLRLGMVARFEPETFHAGSPQELVSWRQMSGHAYVKLRPGANAEAINAQLPALGKRNIPDGPRGPAGRPESKLVNIRDIHLGEAQMGGSSPGTDKGTVLTFGMIALLILGMAVVNFINLATARGSQRAREVALRKVAGASRRQLIVQFLSESILLTAIAMLLGLAFAELLLPYVNAFLDIDMAIRYFGREGLFLPILALVLLVGAAGGIYPAVYLSRFQPAWVLKANKAAAEPEGSGRLRGALVVGQFAVSIGLIICTAVIYSQTVYARTNDAGYRREGLIQVENIRSMPPSQSETLRREVEKIPGVQQAALTGLGVAPEMRSIGFVVPGNPKPITLGTYTVDANFFDTMGMTLLAGRKFDEKIARDNFSPPPDASREAMLALRARGLNVIVTELAAKALGFASAQAAIGKQLDADIIVGVVKDARLRSIREPLEPVIYNLGTDRLNSMMVRYDALAPGKILAEVRNTWRRLFPTMPFNGEFVDDRLRELYQPDEARGRLFGAFALVAVVIGAFGLFGLAAFTAERRTKEIGVRKVLGARTQDIVRLLAWQFSKPVIVANLIAWPVAWWLMRDWLNGFDARITLSPAFFLLAGALALIIAIGTIAGHAIKVARAKPIHALRYE